jgi:uncharacterized membrane protein
VAVNRELEKQARKEFPGLLDRLPGEKKQQILKAIYNGPAVVRQTQHISTFQSSPVPSPDFLVGYNQHIPDGANRLFSMIEKQSAHRIEMETRVITTQNMATLRGQWMALGLVLLMCGIASWAMVIGYPWLSGSIFGTTIIGVATVFISGKTGVKKSLEEKKPQ